MSSPASSSAANPANAYLRTRVLTASPEELRLLLLDGAIKFARQGREGLATKDYEASYNGISQSRNIVLELLTTVKPEHDPVLADRVKALYTYMYVTMVEASMEKSTEKLDSVISLLEYERETWVMLMDQLSKERGGTPAAPASPGSEARPARPALSIQG
jgi:flagellar protein FliS